MLSIPFARHPLASFVTGLSVVLSIPAQASVDSKTDSIETMVVTASGYEQIITEAPASINYGLIY